MSAPILQQPVIQVPESNFSDKENPSSVYNLCPNAVRERVDKMPKELLAKDDDYWKSCQKMKVTPTLQRVRLLFWLEYANTLVRWDNANNSTRKTMRMTTRAILQGTCSYEHFYRDFVSNPYKLGYILTPPVDYTLLVTESLHQSVHKIREILTADVFHDNGKLNTAAANTIINAYKLLDLRVHGAPTQVQKNLNVNVSEKTLDAAERLKDVKQIDQRMNEIESRIKGMETPHLLSESPRKLEVIDVTDSSAKEAPVVRSRGNAGSGSGAGGGGG